MQHEENLSPAEKALESALGQLKPASNTLNRDELMFNAGRVSAGRKGPWQMLSGLLSVLLLGSVLMRPGWDGAGGSPSPSQPASFEVVRAVDYPVHVESSGSLEYVTLRQKVIEGGLDSLPLRQGPRWGNERPMSRRQLLDSMLSS